MALVLTFLVAVDTAHGVPGKVYSDMTVSNSNSDNITSEVVWVPGGLNRYAGIGITDGTSYSPNQVFTNTGNVSLSGVSNSSINFVYVIGSTNSNIKIVNHGDLSLSFGSGDDAIISYGISSSGEVENHGDITINILRQGNYYFHYTTGLFSNGNTLVNTGNMNITLDAGTINVNGHSGTVSGTGISFSGNTMTNSGDITHVARGGIITGTGTQAAATARGIWTNGSIHNTGTITVQAIGGKYRANSSTPFTGDDSTAYGIYASGNLTLNSEGLIWVSAQPAPGQSDGDQKAYQVYVNSGTTTLTGYSMELSNQAQFNSTYKGAIKVNSGAGLAFNNTVLYLSMSNSFTGQEEYEIPMLEEGASAADQ
ncbi:MAG: hypothetical protein MI747_18625, partial [Desulfobacterales bacterium]|nr:hypothetical protein [Desulfobacterales bacterium]